MRCIIVDEPCLTELIEYSLDLLDGTTFVNIQGDEPLINPDGR